MSNDLNIKGSLAVLASATARRVNKGLVSFSDDITLTKHAASEYYFTGSEAKSVNLPETNIMAGWAVLVQNVGSADITIKIGINDVAVVKAGRRIEVVAKSATPAAVADWLVREIATDAVDVDFDPSNSANLTETNVQDVIDELATLIDDAGGDLGDLYTVLGLNVDGTLPADFAGFGDAAGDTNTYLAAINQLLDGAIHKDGSVAMEGDLDLGSNKIVNVAAPENDNDAANKKYVDDAIVDVEELLTKGVIWQRSIEGVVADEAGLPGTPTAGSRYAVQDFNSSGPAIVQRNDANDAWEVFAAGVMGQAAPILDGVTKNSVALFTGVSYETVYWESTEAGDGLQHNGSNHHRIEIDPNLAGNGLSYGTGVLSVDLGENLELDGSDNIQVKLDGTTLSSSAAGIKVNIADNSLEEDSGLKVKLDGSGAILEDVDGLKINVKDGIDIDGNAIRLDPNSAGDGLSYTAGVFSIDGYNGIVVDANGVSVDLADSEPGLEIDGDGKLRTIRDHEVEFVIADFSAASAGESSVIVTAAVHGQGAQPLVQLYEKDGTNYKTVMANQLIVANNGDVTVKVINEGGELDGRFDGKIKIVKSYV